METEDRWNLDRFLSAQAPVYDRVLEELRRGRKQSHWMWFIFPQIAGLGMSETSRHFAISGLEEARAYLADPILGTRLVECTALVNASDNASASAIFGSPDDLKFHSCMTLFSVCGGNYPAFTMALERFFSGKADAKTLARLERDLP